MALPGLKHTKKNTKMRTINLTPKWLLLLAIIVLTILSSCTKHTTSTIVEYERDTVFIHTSDTLYVVKPDTVTITNTDTIFIEPTENCPEPPIIYTDTTWATGNYADAFGFIWANNLVVGIEEGKEFDILLEDAIRETNYYKERYYKEVNDKVITKKPWELYIALVLSLILNVIFLALIFKK